MKIQFLLTLILALIGSSIYLQQKQETSSENLQQKYNLSQVEDEEIERLHKEFVNWENKYGKKYADKTEEEFREIVFDIHELQIEEGNKESDDFNLKPNKYADLTDEEQKLFRTGISDEDEEEERSFWNYIPYLNDHNLLQAEQKMNEQKLQSNGQDGVDYRPYDLGAKDQGYCGTCWAFATNAVLEANFSEKPLSEQYLADCVKEGRKSTGCNYGMSRRGYKQMNFINNVGVGHEEDHPYTMSKNEQNQCKIEENHFQIPSDAEVVAFEDYTTPQCDKLKAMVREYGPTYISVFSSAINFQYYADGIAHHKLDQPWIKKESFCLFGYCLFRDYKVDHAVTLFGYTDDYWIVKNSWGDDWGENGFIRIKMGNYFNICHKGFAIKSAHKKYN